MVETSQPNPERRTMKRVTVMMEVIGGGKRSVCFGKGENISEGGMKINSSQMYLNDSVIKVRFMLPIPPKAIPIEVQAKVIWTEKDSTGIQFLDLKEECREAIVRFVEETPSSQN